MKRVEKEIGLLRRRVEEAELRRKNDNTISA